MHFCYYVLWVYRVLMHSWCTFISISWNDEQKAENRMYWFVRRHVPLYLFIRLYVHESTFYWAKNWKKLICTINKIIWLNLSATALKACVITRQLVDLPHTSGEDFGFETLSSSSGALSAEVIPDKTLTEFSIFLHSFDKPAASDHMEISAFSLRNNPK